MMLTKTKVQFFRSIKDPGLLPNKDFENLTTLVGDAKKWHDTGEPSLELMSLEMAEKQIEIMKAKLKT
jgi:hypothetical protein